MKNSRFMTRLAFALAGWIFLVVIALLPTLIKDQVGIGAMILHTIELIEIGILAFLIGAIAGAL